MENHVEEDSKENCRIVYNRTDFPLSKLPSEIVNSAECLSQNITTEHDELDDDLPMTLAGNLIRQHSAPAAMESKGDFNFRVCPPPLIKSSSADNLTVQIVIAKFLGEDSEKKANMIPLSTCEKKANMIPLSTCTLLSLSVNEISVVMSYLSVKDLVHSLSVSKHIRVVASADLLWMHLFNKYCGGRRKILKQEDIEKKGWLWAYNEYHAPPCIQPFPWTTTDGTLLFLAVLSFMDIATDLIVLVSFYVIGEVGWFVACFILFFPGPISMTIIDVDKSNFGLSSLLNFLGGRVLYTTGKYIIIKRKRRLLTGVRITTDKIKFQASNLESKLKTLKQDAQLAKFIHGVLESCPQAILQTMWLIGHVQFNWVGMLSVIISILSVSIVCGLPGNNTKWSKLQQMVTFILSFFFLLSRLCAYAMFITQFNFYFLCIFFPLVVLKYMALMNEPPCVIGIILAVCLLFIPHYDNKNNSKETSINLLIDTIAVITISTIALSLTNDLYETMWWTKLGIQSVAITTQLVLSILVIHNDWTIPDF